jgi:hypothetical protein
VLELRCNVGRCCGAVPGLRAGSFEFFETDTDCLFGVSARRPHAGFDYFSTRPQALSLHTRCLSYYS